MFPSKNIWVAVAWVGSYLRGSASLRLRPYSILADVIAGGMGIPSRARPCLAAHRPADAIGFHKALVR